MHKALKFLAAFAPILLVAACGGGDDSIDDRLDIADPKVRFIHAIPAGPNVSLYRNTEISGGIDNVPYLYASKYYTVDTAPADYTVKTTTGGITVGAINFNPTRGNKFTLIAVPGEATTTNLLLINDPYDKELTANNARVRVLHASANAGTVDVYLTQAGVDINTVQPNFAGVAYKTANPASGANSVDFTVGSGAYNLTITATGSKTPVFLAPVTVTNNADWLLTVLPASITANDVRSEEHTF
jgi:hypothetical protein